MTVDHAMPRGPTARVYPRCEPLTKQTPSAYPIPRCFYESLPSHASCQPPRCNPRKWRQGLAFVLDNSLPFLHMYARTFLLYPPSFLFLLTPPRPHLSAPRLLPSSRVLLISCHRRKTSSPTSVASSKSTHWYSTVWVRSGAGRGVEFTSVSGRAVTQ